MFFEMWNLHLITAFILLLETIASQSRCQETTLKVFNLNSWGVSYFDDFPNLESLEKDTNLLSGNSEDPDCITICKGSLMSKSVFIVQGHPTQTGFFETAMILSCDIGSRLLGASKCHN